MWVGSATNGRSKGMGGTEKARFTLTCVAVIDTRLLREIEREEIEHRLISVSLLCELNFAI